MISSFFRRDVSAQKHVFYVRNIYCRIEDYCFKVEIQRVQNKNDVFSSIKEVNISQTLHSV